MRPLAGWVLQATIGLVLGVALWSTDRPLLGVVTFALVSLVLPTVAWWWFERKRPEPTGRALAERIRRQERALAVHEALLGHAHPETLTTRNNLALDYTLAGRPVEAVRHYEIALTYGIHVQGANHPETLILRRNLTEAYRAAGWHDAAVRQLELAHRGTVRAYGPRHRETRDCRARLARLRRETTPRGGEVVPARTRVRATCARPAVGYEPTQ